MNVHGKEGMEYNKDRDKRWKEDENPEITESKTW